MTNTAVEWLPARIAEDEKAACQATSGPWTVDRDTGDVGPVDDCGRPDCARLMVSLLPVDDDGAALPRPANALHVARWDPARVLAECEAKRRIVELYTEAIAWAENAEDDNGYDEHVRGAAEGAVADMRAVVRALALPYAHRDDCPEELKQP